MDQNPQPSSEQVLFTQPQTQPSTIGNQPKNPSWIKWVVAITVMIAIVIGGFFFLSQQNQTKQLTPTPTTTLRPTPTTMPSPSPIVQVPSDWKLFRQNDDGWTVMYPQEMTVQVRENQIGENEFSRDTTFYVWGQTQSEGTELYDGLSVTFRVIDIDDSLEKEANERTKPDENAGSTREYFRPVEIAGLKGYEAQVSGLGVFVHYFLSYKNDPKKALWISTLSVGPNKTQFDQDLSVMLSTLKYQ